MRTYSIHTVKLSVKEADLLMKNLRGKKVQQRTFALEINVNSSFICHK